MKTYLYQIIGKDMYKIMKIDNKQKQGERFEEYIINLKNGDAMCSCKGFYFTKKPCKHIRFILEQLSNGGGILQFEKAGQVDLLFKEGK